MKKTTNCGVAQPALEENTIITLAPQVLHVGENYTDFQYFWGAVLSDTSTSRIQALRVLKAINHLQLFTKRIEYRKRRTPVLKIYVHFEGAKYIPHLGTCVSAFQSLLSCLCIGCCEAACGDSPRWKRFISKVRSYHQYFWAPFQIKSSWNLINRAGYLLSWSTGFRRRSILSSLLYSW